MNSETDFNVFFTISLKVYMKKNLNEKDFKLILDSIQEMKQQIISELSSSTTSEPQFSVFCMEATDNRWNILCGIKREV